MPICIGGGLPNNNFKNEKKKNACSKLKLGFLFTVQPVQTQHIVLANLIKMKFQENEISRK